MALQAATQAMSGDTGTAGTVATTQITQLRKFTSMQLKELKTRTNSEEKALSGEVERLKGLSEAASELDKIVEKNETDNKKFKEAREAEKISDNPSDQNYMDGVKVQEMVKKARTEAQVLKNEDLKTAIGKKADDAIVSLNKPNVKEATDKSFQVLIHVRSLAAKQNFEEEQKKLKDFPALTLKRTQEILDEYETVLRGLQNSVIPTDQKAEGAKTAAGVVSAVGNISSLPGIN